MEQRGYNRPFILGMLAAGGRLGSSFPVDTTDHLWNHDGRIDSNLVHGGIGPGLFLAGSFIVYSIIYAIVGGGYEPMARASRSERRHASIRALPTVLLRQPSSGRSTQESQPLRKRGRWIRACSCDHFRDETYVVGKSP